MAKLDGKIALVSGGTSGIGAETAKLFQSEGATVIVTGSSERSVEAAKAALLGIEVLLSDAGNVAATEVLVDQVKAKHGRIDVLFVNAGIAKFAPIAQVDEAFYDSHFNINVAFFLIKHAIPVIPDGGAIILTASVAGANGGPGSSSIYGSTKAALRSFGRTIAKELTPRGIRVNHQPRSDYYPNPRQRRPHAGSEGRFYRGGQDPHTPRPHRHRSRSRRSSPLSRRGCHLYHRSRTVRRRWLDRPIGRSDLRPDSPEIPSWLGAGGCSRWAGATASSYLAIWP
jgi:NADP-dependent 3-hydroxy acid dehydrogenase YdfG